MTQTQNKESVLYFDGNGDYITIANNDSLRVDKYTVELWFKTEGVPYSTTYATETTLFGREYPHYSYRIKVLTSGCIQHEWYEKGQLKEQNTPSGSITWDKWYHVAITNDGTAARTYIDGELKAESVVRDPLSVTAAEIKMAYSHYHQQYYNSSTRRTVYNDNTYYRFKGSITEVRLWNDAHSEDDIKNGMYRRLEGDERGIVGYWPLDNIANNTATDKTQNKNHGKIYGAVRDDQLPVLGGKGQGQDKRTSVLTWHGSGNVIVENFTPPTDAITINLWAKSNLENWASNTYLFRSSYCYIQTVSSKKQINFYINTDSGTQTLTSTDVPNFDLTDWHHYAATFDGRVMRIYIDGIERGKLIVKLDSQDAAKLRSSAGNLTFYGYNSEMTKVEVWNKGLSATDVQSSMTTPLKGDEKGLMGYWPLDEGHGDIATDITSNNRNGKITHHVWDEQFPLGFASISQPVTDIKISDLSYKSNGDHHKTNQYVEITNNGTWTIDLSGWTLTSLVKKKPKHKYTFPTGTQIEGGQSIRVYNDKYNPQWGGFTFSSEWGVWKNSGDKATLSDATGKEISTFAFGDQT